MPDFPLAKRGFGGIAPLRNNALRSTLPGRARQPQRITPLGNARTLLLRQNRVKRMDRQDQQFTGRLSLYEATPNGKMHEVKTTTHIVKAEFPPEGQILAHEWSRDSLCLKHRTFKGSGGNLCVPMYALCWGDKCSSAASQLNLWVTVARSAGTEPAGQSPPRYRWDESAGQSPPR